MRLAIAGALVLALALAQPAGAATRVTVSEDVFGPTALTVSKNTKVKWVWTGEEKHNLSVKQGPEKFRSPLQDSGVFKHVMDKKGVYQLVCTVHEPDMAMTLTVR